MPIRVTCLGYVIKHLKIIFMSKTEQPLYIRFQSQSIELNSVSESSVICRIRSNIFLLISLFLIKF